jgi:hypothetical protein
MENVTLCDMIHITIRRLEYPYKIIHRLQLNDLNVFVLAIFPTLLNLLKPLGFFYTNLAHMVQHLA